MCLLGAMEQEFAFPVVIRADRIQQALLEEGDTTCKSE